MTAESKPLRPGQIVFTIIYLLSYPVILLLLAGDIRWVEGWIFGIWFVVMCVTTILYLYQKDPALLVERYRVTGSGNQKGWDKYVVIGLALGFILWFAIMPLDAKRLRLTLQFPVGLKILGGLMLVFSFFFFFRSFTDNTFLSPLVRIQTERKHQVVSTGVYGFVRHPMYLGATLLFVGAPMLLGSSYGLGVGVALAVLLVGRIMGEEKVLVNELEGYSQYRKKVKYRLIPGIW